MARLYLLLDKEVETLLADNEIDLISELRNQGINVEGTRDADPGADGTGKERDLVLVIIASGAAFAAVSFGISRIIDALGRNKRTIIEERDLLPVIDKRGNPVKGADGEPKMYWRTRQKIADPVATAESSDLQISAGGEMGLKVSMRTGGEIKSL